MQCISSFNKNSLILTFNIYIYSRLRLNSITVFSSTSTRTHSGCVELPQRLQLEINCLNGKKTKMIKPVWIRKLYFSVEKFFCCCCSLWLTFKCNVLFGLVCTENTRKRLKASKNDWIQALHVVLNSSNSHRLQIEIFASHTRTWNIIAACSRQWTRKTVY